MSRRLPVLLAVAFFLATNPATPAQKTPAAADIRGVWKVTELAWRAPGAEWEDRTPSLSQYIFTGKHYSYMYVPGAGPRKLFAGDPNRPTDAEKVEAYNSFIAASGTYTLSGQILTTRALVHKNPNEMTGKPLTYTVEFDGNTLRMVIANPPFLPGRESRTVLTRIE
jgi:Lipocalin-like domain